MGGGAQGWAPGSLMPWLSHGLGWAVHGELLVSRLLMRFPLIWRQTHSEQIASRRGNI